MIRISRACTHARGHVAAWITAVTALSVLALAPAAHAQDAKSTTPTGEDTPLTLPNTDSVQNVSGGGGLVRTIIGLLVVIAVIYGITWVLKQVKASNEEDGRGHALDSSASMPLGPGRSVHLVRAGNEYLLLGVSDGGVTTLRSYTEAEADAAGLLDAPDSDEFRERRGPSGTPANVGEAVADCVERLRSLTVRR